MEQAGIGEQARQGGTNWNRVEQPGKDWNRLERRGQARQARTTQKRLEQAGTGEQVGQVEIGGIDGTRWYSPEKIGTSWNGGNRLDKLEQGNGGNRPDRLEQVEQGGTKGTGCNKM